MLIVKGQVHGVEKGTIIGQISFIASLFGLVA
ncbi:MAG TPA: integrase [Ktedonobacter sp.]|nr:integrase [Ktedonobacter sp.]HBE26779.1 integrase [Ktedonobacter sp.]HCP75099.1 integrase [Ktedonobacter sp.]